jgi:translin
VSQMTENLDQIAERIRAGFGNIDQTREKVLPLCREVIRYSSVTIRALHRQEFAPARETLASARSLLEEARQAMDACPELRGVGAYQDAAKEFAEASITLALITGNRTPEPEDLAVDFAAYLNGMGEAVGELRRYLLDSIRRDDLTRVEELLFVMDDIYNILVTMDFPDAITGGLRRTTDMVRGILERTRSDLTLVIQQRKLEDKLAALEKKPL